MKASKSAIKSIHTEKDTSWHPEKEPVGFFPAPATAKYAPLPPPPRDTPIKRDGLIPNSVLARILWPLPPEAEREEKEYRPPVFSQDMEDELDAARDKVSVCLCVCGGGGG